jgi:hypothetical protein
MERDDHNTCTCACTCNVLCNSCIVSYRILFCVQWKLPNSEEFVEMDFRTFAMAAKSERTTMHTLIHKQYFFHKHTHTHTHTSHTKQSCCVFI